MFEDLIREIRNLERGMTVSVPIPTDEKGFLDRACPSKNCGATFKVHGEDWDTKVTDDQGFCPLCRYAAKSEDWATPEQMQYAKSVAMRKFESRLHSALETGARGFNQRQRPGFITMSMSVSPHSPHFVLPCRVADIMEQQFECEKCACRYSSVGAAFFCPACGHNSSLSVFSHTLETVQKTLEAIPAIRQAFGDDKDGAENAIRLVVEQSLGKLVGAFEHYSEAVYEMVPTASLAKVKRGSFQRLAEASKLWREAVNVGYDDILTQAEFADLFSLFQKRHLLTHTDGIVDADYLQKTNDKEYAIGQRIVVRAAHVVELLTLLQKLGAKLKTFLPSKQISTIE
jgi:hypothetical protein